MSKKKWLGMLLTVAVLLMLIPTTGLAADNAIELKATGATKVRVGEESVIKLHDDTHGYVSDKWYAYTVETDSVRRWICI